MNKLFHLPRDCKNFPWKERSRDSARRTRRRGRASNPAPPCSCRWVVGMPAKDRRRLRQPLTATSWRCDHHRQETGSGPSDGLGGRHRYRRATGWPAGRLCRTDWRGRRDVGRGGGTRPGPHPHWSRRGRGRGPTATGWATRTASRSPSATDRTQICTSIFNR